MIQITTPVATLGSLDIAILATYALILIGMGFYYMRRSNTGEKFMVAGRGIPAWAAGLAVMSTYTSSISYIATPGKAFDSNWHPLIFALSLLPVTWVVGRYVIPYYRKSKLISVYEFLGTKLGGWARSYAAFSFLLYMVGRIAVISYLTAILLNTFLPWPIELVIILVGMITVIYTLAGGMEAVIWTDVFCSFVMISGIAACAVLLTVNVLTDPGTPLQALRAEKFTLGSWDFSLGTRTVWVMLIYGITENLRNLIADQNYVQKYSTTATSRDATRSIWISALIYLPLNVIFLFIGTMLFAFYSGNRYTLAPEITKGDQVFPHFIATQMPTGLRGLLIAAIVAAAMSTLSSDLNCSATVSHLDFYKRYIKPDISDRHGVLVLRIATLFWAALGTGSALLMIHARSALDTWWQISGMFGGGIFGLFLLALLRAQLKPWQGITGILASLVVIGWLTLSQGTFWWQGRIDEILIGFVGTITLIVVALMLRTLNGRKAPVQVAKGA